MKCIIQSQFRASVHLMMVLQIVLWERNTF